MSIVTDKLNYIEVPAVGSSYDTQYYGQVEGQVHYCRHRHLTPYGAMRCAERHFAEKEKTVKVHKQFV